MNPLLLDFVTALFRSVIFYVAGRVGVAVSGDVATQWAASLSLVALGLGLSFYQKYRSRQKLTTALSSSKPMTEGQLEHQIAGGVAAPVSVPKDVVPKAVLP